MKKLLSVLLALTVAASLAFAAGGKQESGGTKKLKFAQIYSVVHPFFEPCDRGGKAKAADLGSDLVIDSPARPDIALQVNMIENYINQGVDGIAIFAVAGEGLEPVIAKAMDAGIPVIMFGVDSAKSRRIAYIGTNHEEFAEHAADLLAAQMNNTGDIIVNMGVPTAPDQIVRVDHFQKYIGTKYPAMKVVDVQASNSDPARSLANAETMWQAHPDVKGYYGADAVAGAAIISAQKSKGKKVAAVVGDDGAEIVAGIRNGDIPVSIVQDVYGWAYEGIQALYDVKMGKKIPEMVFTKLIDLTKTNVDQMYPQK
jgi:ribose transport system substrate-binding protein